MNLKNRSWLLFETGGTSSNLCTHTRDRAPPRAWGGGGGGGMKRLVILITVMGKPEMFTVDSLLFTSW